MDAISSPFRPLSVSSYGTRPRGHHRRPSPSFVISSTANDGSNAAYGIRREVLTPSQRTKLNNYDDREWYAFPRFVHHSDEAFRSSVTQLYREMIQPVPPATNTKDVVVLDLCSSWVSHLPPEIKYGAVIGHGLNAAELARNKRLDKFFVRNLNKEPNGWAVASDSVDAVLMCCSVQYLQQPERVFAEIARVLRPRGVCIVTFTHNLYYEKAIAVWRDASSMYSRSQLVKQYFMAVDGGFSEPKLLRAPANAPPTSDSTNYTNSNIFDDFLTFMNKNVLEKLRGADFGSDPFYAVVAYKLD